MKVEEGLKVDEPSSEEMLRLLEDSTEFDLDLPQIPLLHEVSLAGGGVVSCHDMCGIVNTV